MAPARHEGHVQLLLGAYVLGGLSASEEAVVRAHLSRCGRCRAEHDELACVPSWLDLLSSDRAGTGQDEVRGTERGRDAEPGRDPGRPDGQGS
jgi:anti-sigma factor RsiW